MVEATKAAWERDDISPADRLRKEANEMEAKDAAILRFREAVAALEPEA
jgi:hypothetical protein